MRVELSRCEISRARVCRRSRTGSRLRAAGNGGVARRRSVARFGGGFFAGGKRRPANQGESRHARCSLRFAGFAASSRRYRGRDRRQSARQREQCGEIGGGAGSPRQSALVFRGLDGGGPAPAAVRAPGGASPRLPSARGLALVGAGMGHARSRRVDQRSRRANRLAAAVGNPLPGLFPGRRRRGRGRTPAGGDVSNGSHRGAAGAPDLFLAHRLRGIRVLRRAGMVGCCWTCQPRGTTRIASTRSTSSFMFSPRLPC